MAATGTRVAAPVCRADDNATQRDAARCLARYGAALNACNAQLPE